ncbi:MAG: amino acid-binding protein [Rhodospirillales bacterium]|nr:amino acid-binding protein [Rhodospirillales bacterium]
MSLTALVSIIGPDRVGLVSAIAGRLFDLGANLGDTAFAVLGGGAEFTAICEFSAEMDLETLERELEALPELDGAEVNVSRFDLAAIHPASETITHMITVSGGDSPGLMARLCEVFEQFNANIVRLNSERVPGGGGNQYVITTAVAIPTEATSSCLATIANTAGELGLDYDYTQVDI